MTTRRCPSCGASVAAEAPWCTLCFAALRPSTSAPELLPEPVPVPVPVPVPAVAAAALDPLGDSPVMTLSRPEQPAELTWPCTACGARVSLDLDHCNLCQRPFLAGDPAPTLRLPGVGNLASMDTTSRLVFCAGGGLLLTVLLVVLGFVVGSFV